MQTHLYKNDLDDGITFKGNIAMDTEAMGLDPARDRLCLIQIFDGKTDCHMVQFENSNTESPNLIKLLNDENIQKISLKKIKTMCSYKYYIYDDEVLSYRSIYLNQINDKDFYYGLGWIVDLKNININDL